jgi:hypothetical protein
VTPRPPRRQITPDRKVIYYAGLAASGFGVVTFLASFFAFATAGARFDTGGAFSAWGCAFVGMILMGLGRTLMRVGARGYAGSGIVLDPDRTRRDLEPWARTAGGLAADALSEMPALRETLGAAPAPVNVRCRACRALNDEDARFCGQCGAAL